MNDNINDLKKQAILNIAFVDGLRSVSLLQNFAESLFDQLEGPFFFRGRPNLKCLIEFHLQPRVGS